MFFWSFDISGPKTITLFAPTDKAFAGLSPEDLTKTVTDPTLAKELVLKHMIQGSLYTNGMRYYQVKDSFQKDSQITISKHSGKFRYQDTNCWLRVLSGNFSKKKQ